MNRPSPPRLPELAGMTEAGFNRVVAMITPKDFMPRDRFGGRCGTDFHRAAKAWEEWRWSLPKARNKKQRKLIAKELWLAWDDRAPLQRLQQFDAMLDAASVHFTEPGPRTIPDVSEWDFENIPDDDAEPTPLQRIQQFAAETGVPVSFEIAEKAMKGGG